MYGCSVLVVLLARSSMEYSLFSLRSGMGLCRYDESTLRWLRDEELHELEAGEMWRRGEAHGVRLGDVRALPYPWSASELSVALSRDFTICIIL